MYKFFFTCNINIKPKLILRGPKLLRVVGLEGPIF